MFDICFQSSQSLEYQQYWSQNEETLTQFVLDPTSFNLSKRVNINDSTVQKLFALARDMCFGIHNERIRKMKVQ